MRKLSADEIRGVYGIPPVFAGYKWPNTTHLVEGKGAYWVFLTYFDTPKVAVVLKAIELMERGLVSGKSYFDVAMDIRTIIYKSYVHYTDKVVYPIATYGSYFREILREPAKYI